MKLAETVTPGDISGGLLFVGGFIAVMFLLAVVGYNLQGAFARPGTLRQRAGRFLFAVGAICAIVYLVPIFWGPGKQ